MDQYALRHDTGGEDWLLGKNGVLKKYSLPICQAISACPRWPQLVAYLLVISAMLSSKRWGFRLTSGCFCSESSEPSSYFSIQVNLCVKSRWKQALPIRVILLASFPSEPR
jgi:hypothetical protein